MGSCGRAPHGHGRKLAAMRVDGCAATPVVVRIALLVNGRLVTRPESGGFSVNHARMRADRLPIVRNARLRGRRGGAGSSRKYAVMYTFYAFACASIHEHGWLVGGWSACGSTGALVRVSAGGSAGGLGGLVAGLAAARAGCAPRRLVGRLAPIPLPPYPAGRVAAGGRAFASMLGRGVTW